VLEAWVEGVEVSDLVKLKVEVLVVVNAVVTVCDVVEVLNSMIEPDVVLVLVKLDAV
jgi:hypothetical protein